MLYIHSHSSGKPPPEKSRNPKNGNYKNFQEKLQSGQKASKKAKGSVRKIQANYYLERKLFF